MYVIGTAYGKGVYFAEKADYSANSRYSSPDKFNNRYMFQAEVLTGEFEKGNPQLIQPPKKNNSETDLYDSCVDDTDHPNIFVIFRDFQAYPAYLITFTKAAL